MDAVERLEQDHDRFRKQLDALETALRLGREAGFVVRDLCVSLSAWLSDHRQREGRLIISCRSPLTVRELTRLAVGHGEEFQGLHAAICYFAEHPSADGLGGLRPSLRSTIARFRSHMDEQEYKLFPTLEWVLGQTAARPVTTPATPGNSSAGSEEHLLVMIPLDNHSPAP